MPQSSFDKAEPMKGDLHHLFTCQTECNSFRGNTPYFDFADFEEVVRERLRQARAQPLRAQCRQGRGGPCSRRLVSSTGAGHRRRAHRPPRRAVRAQRGHDLHVLDVVTKGPEPPLMRDLGATYHSGSPVQACQGADMVVECTGVGELIFDLLPCPAPAGIVCLTGVSSGGRLLNVDAALSRELVLENDVVFGTVNANAGHYQAAVAALLRADAHWVGRLVTRRIALRQWSSALDHRPEDVKVVIDLDR